MSSYQRHHLDLRLLQWLERSREFRGPDSDVQRYARLINIISVIIIISSQRGHPSARQVGFGSDLIIGFRLLYYSDVCSDSHFDTPDSRFLTRVFASKSWICTVHASTPTEARQKASYVLFAMRLLPALILNRALMLCNSSYTYSSQAPK